MAGTLPPYNSAILFCVIHIFSSSYRSSMLSLLSPTVEIKVRYSAVEERTSCFFEVFLSSFMHAPFQICSLAGAHNALLIAPPDGVWHAELCGCPCEI